MLTLDELRARLGTTAFSFRGYNVTNLGRTRELLERPAYASIVEATLREVSQIAADALGRQVDLAGRVREGRETCDLTTYAEDVALIVGVEAAQLRLLEQHFGIGIRGARLAFGYSLGEAGALIATEVFELPHLLRVPLQLADDCAALAHDVTMGVLASHGEELSQDLVERLCLQITQEGQGTIAVSTRLSPNGLLLLGQGDTVDRFREAMKAVLPKATLRKNAQRWPPLHTPIMWQRHIPDRAALLLQGLPGGLAPPSIPVLSGTTGKESYKEHNSRFVLRQWVDHPQQLWSVVYNTLAAGVETVLHVGPDPNLIPATFKRLSDNVVAQLAGYSPASLGLRAVSHMARRPWLTRVLPTRAALLRAPFLIQIRLEDWLLEQQA